MKTITAVSLLAGVTLLVVRFLMVGRRPKNYPPGPPTLPVIGNLHQMPSKDAHLQFEKWAREYGPVYSLILGTKTMVVLSSDKAVKDLLDKKSSLYSHRPEMYIGQNLCSGNLRVLMMPYGPRWRNSRKLVHGLLNVSAAKSYVPYQMLENKQMLHDMLVQPDRFLHHIRRYSNALTTTMVFGWRTPTYEDEKMQQLFDGFSEFAELNQTGMAALIDFFPFLRRIPESLSKTQKYAKELHKKEKALYMQHWLRAKKETQEGTIKPCFCEEMFKVQKKEDISDDQAAYITGTLLEAGSDTTSSTLYAFVQAMLLYPKVQEKAQEEIERVVGSDRMPTMEDEPNLQYIRSCVKESLRWMPTTILGAVPHAVTQDDWYEGYLIPKNAGVVNNVWSINMDPRRHPNPRVFEPERYMNDFQSLADAAANPDGTKRDQFTFGAGRRICPGIHVAERSLFLGVARILWAFNIEPASDENGKPIIPDPDKLTQGFVCMPEEFPAKITPRSQARAEKVAQDWREAQEECLDPATQQWIVTPVSSRGGAKA
ncbi:Fumitremorgin C synthase-like protein [Hapsidospora chrysogenum ATCC 11550]|uniref:Fumitremorgin C synthase-like protein n=1 Tax=Hapsidospora chrysogenum (strain ATCC 11550 / CBS 779.69 / DSM 880 / IAM 14645 / JCM 23072 / IMI 49137) TaxID=857340 RepID=A0A086T8H4_HAPC1|nr:Fumitremorgin C synthase-like protein [Hapsidospora chrysogenum ATCC 11550]